MDGVMATAAGMRYVQNVVAVMHPSEETVVAEENERSSQTEGEGQTGEDTATEEEDG